LTIIKRSCHSKWAKACFNVSSYLYYVLSLSSRTLTSVHESILEDLCFPSEIVGKRIRIKLDGSRLIKVHLEKTQQTNIEHKVYSTCHNSVSLYKIVFPTKYVKKEAWYCEMMVITKSLKFTWRQNLLITV